VRDRDRLRPAARAAREQQVGERVCVDGADGRRGHSPCGHARHHVAERGAARRHALEDVHVLLRQADSACGGERALEEGAVDEELRDPRVPEKLRELELGREAGERANGDCESCDAISRARAHGCPRGAHQQA
jgi:hypothetical protein